MQFPNKSDQWLQGDYSNEKSEWCGHGSTAGQASPWWDSVCSAKHWVRISHLESGGDGGKMKGGEGSGLLIDGNGGDEISHLGGACECFHHGDPPIMGGWG